MRRCIPVVVLSLLLGVGALPAQDCGDCDGNLIVNILDALHAAKHDAGLTTVVSPSFEYCNVQGAPGGPPGGAVSILDALEIARYVAGLVFPLACGSIPACTITTPSPGVPAGDVTLDWQAQDLFSTPVDMIPTWSTDAGATWNPALEAGGSGTAGLTSSPAPGTAHTFVWDSAGDNVGAGGPDSVIFRLEVSHAIGAGSCSTASFVVDNAAPVDCLAVPSAPFWSQLAGTMPPARTGHTWVYDSTRQRGVMFGGHIGPAACCRVNDTWAFDFATSVWSQLSPAGTLPDARNVHTAIYDPVGDRMLVFGGINNSSIYLNDLWELDFGSGPAGTWTQLSPTGTPPLARTESASAYVDTGAVRRMLVVAGYRSPSMLEDVWELNITGGVAAWSELFPGGLMPPNRTGAAVAFDPARERLLSAWGFSQSFTNLCEVHALATVPGAETWSLHTPSGSGPSCRAYTFFAHDILRDRLIVFSGRSSPNDTWELCLVTDVWTQLTPGGTLPVARNDHKIIYDPVTDRVLIYGGRTGSTRVDQTWQLAF